MPDKHGGGIETIQYVVKGSMKFNVITSLGARYVQVTKTCN